MRLRDGLYTTLEEAQAAHAELTIHRDALRTQLLRYDSPVSEERKQELI